VRAIERPGDAPAGRVFEQRPGPLTTLARGATVTIRVANGRAP
jgi:beta-lactam-binding protein with PASTA domain